jgi:hypothetical protein
MLYFIIGIVVGWFAHLHYGVQIVETFARITGGV